MTRPKLGIEIELQEWLLTLGNKERKRVMGMALQEQLLLLANERERPVLPDGEWSLLENPSFIVTIAKFIREHGKIYRIAREFGHHLAETDLDVPCRCLPLDKSIQYWIELPKAWKTSDNKFVHSALVNIGKPEIKCSKEVPIPVELDIVARKLDVNNKPLEEGVIFHTFLTYANPDHLLKEVVSTDNEEDLDLFNFIVKCVLYIESGEPDLVREVGNPPLSSNIKKRIRHLKDYCPFDVTNVGYGFHHKTHHVNSWEVNGHFRWQRYGEKLSKVKLIWIDTQVRSRREINVS